jgi:hypothetical protein
MKKLNSQSWPEVGAQSVIDNYVRINKILQCLKDPAPAHI